jgi:predicted RNA binding protein YcfA (HicA-like mRNA interferase family)
MPMSGKEMLRLYERDGWRVAWQTGSHVRVKKGALSETIPMHKELKKGMEHNLLKVLKEAN